jgi:hypothetical protein
MADPQGYILNPREAQQFREMSAWYARRKTWMRPRSRSSPIGHGGDTRVWAKVSSNCTKSGTYNGKSATRNATEFDETASGALSIATYYDFASAEDQVLVNFFETGTDSHILPVNCVIFGWRKGATKSSKPIIELDHFFAGVFQVACTQTGGSDGSATTAASYTYTVKTQDGVTTLGTGVAVTGPRPKGLTNVGTVGIAYYDSSGALKLWSAGETPTSGTCT